MKTSVSVRPRRLTLVVDHPAQQFVAGYRLLAQREPSAVEVIYWSAESRVLDPNFGRVITWDTDLFEGYPWVCAPAGLRSSARRISWLLAHLRHSHPDVVVSYGWVSPAACAAICYAALTRTRLLFYGDTSSRSPMPRRRALRRSLVLRSLFRIADGAVAVSGVNREFYRQHGMAAAQILPGVLPADIDPFIEAAAKPRSAGSPTRIGFAGKLTHEKGIDELLRAIALLPDDGSWALTVVGDGPLREQLESLTTELGLSEQVRFHGFANTSEMPGLLAGFDVVVVPSRREPYGLVAVEAMAAGAAVVVSDVTGVWGPGDALRDGVTGMVYRSGRPDELADVLSRLIDDPSLRQALGTCAQECSRDFGPSAYARTMGAAVSALVDETRVDARRAGRRSLTALAGACVRSYSVLRFVLSHPANRRRRIRQVFRAVRFQVRGRRGLPTMVPIGRNARMLVDLHDTAGSKVVYANPPDWNEMRAWENILTDGDHFLDVGANVGAYSLWAAQLGATVTAVEPHPVTAAALRRNIELNPFSIEVRQAALADRCGTMRLTESLGAGNHLLTGEADDGIEVPVSTLDELIGDRPRVFVKMDVEGSEWLVLRGGIRALRERRIVAMQLEWNRQSAKLFGRDRSELAIILADHRYSLCRATEAGQLVRCDGTEDLLDVFAIADHALNELVGEPGSARSDRIRPPSPG